MQPIGFFDSGVGGLSIWKEVQKLIPFENTLYLADNKNAPYGEKTREEIIFLSEKNTEYLLENNVKLIVVACNTASTNAIPHLRQKYKVPFIRIQPAIKPAGLMTRTKKIGLLATAGTIQSSMLGELKQQIPTQDIEIFSRYGKGLVEIVENCEMDSQETKKLLQKYLLPMKKNGIDQLVLGCTHYPFLKQQMEAILGNKVNIIDPSPAIARQVKRVLEKEGKLAVENRNPEYLFFANKKIDAMKKLLTPYPSALVLLKDF